MKVSYSNLLGKRASWRLQTLVLPHLVWNQQVYGTLLVHELQARPGPRWLDAGCGHRVLTDGLEALEDRAVAPANFVVGIDVDPSGLLTHRNIQRRVCTSLHAMPFANESFDVVTCNMVAEHLADPRKCMAEITRVLAPGGVVVIHTPNLRHYMVFLNHTLGRLLPRRWREWAVRAAEGRISEEIFPAFYRMNSLARLRKLAGEFDLETEHAEVLPSPRPFFNFLLPLAAVQLLLMRLMTLRPLKNLEATLLVVLRKPEIDRDAVSQLENGASG